MRTRTFIIMLITAAELVACKEVKVGLDDSAQSTLDCLVKGNCDETDSNNGDDTSYSDSDDENHDSASSNPSDTEDTSDETSTETSGNDGIDPSDSTGGIGALPDSKRGNTRYFMGTYELKYAYNYDSCTSDYGNSYDFPATIRTYSYENKIDFEDSLDNLMWVADVYPDDTFDFTVQLLDSFGRPSNRLACTCTLEDYSSYYSTSESLKCSCDPSYQEDDICALTYDKL